MTLTITKFALAGVVSLVLVGRPSAEAQQPHVARIEVISDGSPASSAASVDPFRQRLRELGYVNDSRLDPGPGRSCH